MSTPAGSATDTYRLERFVRAQEGVFERACAELAAGRKTSHWMWFIFPQTQGLGQSATAQHFAIASLAEAQAYLAHPLLGSRLDHATRHVLFHEAKPLNQIFGTPDDLKFRSSMTLFAKASGAHSLFAEAIDRMCAGVADPVTIKLLNASLTR
jgi:uncharacterized protein (DUF1810 family)